MAQIHDKMNSLRQVNNSQLTNSLLTDPMVNLHFLFVLPKSWWELLCQNKEHIHYNKHLLLYLSQLVIFFDRTWHYLVYSLTDFCHLLKYLWTCSLIKHDMYSCGGTTVIMPECFGVFFSFKPLCAGNLAFNPQSLPHSLSGLWFCQGAIQPCRFDWW